MELEIRDRQTGQNFCPSLTGDWLVQGLVACQVLAGELLLVELRHQLASSFVGAVVEVVLVGDLSCRPTSVVDCHLPSQTRSHQSIVHHEEEN